jgi:hypothetical protein
MPETTDLYLLFLPTPGQPRQKTANGRWKPAGRLKLKAAGPNGAVLAGSLRLPTGALLYIEAYPTKQCRGTVEAVEPCRA